MHESNFWRGNSPYYFYMNKLALHLEKGESNYDDPLKVAKLITRICVKPTTKLRYTIGNGVTLTILLKSILPWRLWERIVMKKIE